MNDPARDRLQVGEAAVARIAAAAAAGVPGVVALRSDLGQALLGLAGPLLGERAPTGGATAVVAGGRAEVSLTLVTTLGVNPRDLAETVQREVAARLLADTALVATVTVTIADIQL